MDSGSPPLVRVRNDENTVILAKARIHLRNALKIKMDPGSISLSRKVQDDVFTTSPRLFGVPPCVSPPPYARNPMSERSFLFTNGSAFLRP
ncbi:MAG: hypothetical protein JWN13_3424 [Betaproteobacteria bacterium]|jgi:hypothetical protein|nr:hypothetical protein [Betaproteobacteria bacterium]